MTQQKVYFNRGIIERFRNTIDMVTHYTRDYTLMQYIEKGSGRRINYAPDYPPSTYEDVSNIICVFKVHKKEVPSFITRFKYYWKFYK